MRHIAWVWALVFLAFSAGSFMAYAEGQPSVEIGKKLFAETPLGTNGKFCASCHKTTENIIKDTAKHPDDPGLKMVLIRQLNVTI
ncbi:MAG: hypothetical protein ACYDFU_10505 [Nitrospirota bacterium]